jgi:predicted ATPase/class 3 adenylate cyclase
MKKLEGGSMSPSIEEQIERLKSTIAEMEAQREALGDELVDAGLAPFQRKLDELVAQLEARQAGYSEVTARQRKLVTLLFMDIAGSTSIAQHMDPEDVGEVFDAALKKLAGPIQEHGGRVTRFMGDGFLSVFGAPTAREDDPEQAVRAGLKILSLAGEVVRELENQWEIEGFQVRIGINTGLVLLGGETEAEDTLMGSPVNLAARLENAAPPGGLLVSHDTYRHIRGVFDVEPWEPLQVKGFDEAVQVYKVLRARPRAFRIYTRGVEGVETRMIGRHDELKYLQDALLTAIEEDEGQLVTITGEAGVGKSRLLYEFENWIELQPQQVYFFEGRGRQEAQGLPYGLLRDMFGFRFQIQDEDSAETAREKIQTGFTEVFDGGNESLMRAHILGQLLGFDLRASPHLKGMLEDAEQLRNRALMYLGEYFQELCRQDPVVILLEDIHWADDSSLDALNWLGERMQYHPFLVVCAARQSLFERRPYWGEGLVYNHYLELEPLSRRESRQLVAEILKLADQVPPELSRLVVEGAEGNPFYVEELVKMLVEDGVIIKGEETWQVHPGRLTEIEVPPTLAGVLQARLDSLPVEERAVLQQASVVGRLFWDRVVAHIQAAVGGSPQEVPNALTALHSREMVYRREASTFTDAREYLFKHDILREVTYEGVLKRLRRRYHGLVADWMIAHIAERAGEYSGMIAGHLLLAGRVEQAGEFFLQAGQAALTSYANHEAEGYFRQVLELSPPDDQKAACLAGLGEALSRQGRRDDSIEVFRQGIDLYLELEQSDAAADLYARLARALWWDDYQKAWQACQEGLRRLEGTPDSPGMARLLAEAGRTAHFRARPSEEVISLCQRAIEIAERQGEVKAKADASINIALATDDSTKRYQLMQEAAAFCEANGLWRQARRAYNNLGSLSSENLQGLESVYKYYSKSVEIAVKIGDIEGLLFGLENLASILIDQGHLKTVEDQSREILDRSTVPPSRAEEFLEELRAMTCQPKGEWDQAAEFSRQYRDEARQGGKIQEIATCNLGLASACMELNQFVEMIDLSEAEAALRENIDMDWDAVESRFEMAVLLSQQERYSEAREWLAEVIDDLNEPISGINQALTIWAQAEIARAESRWDEALLGYQTIIEYTQQYGYRWQLARQLINLGDVLQGRDETGDREKAKEAFSQSLEMFKEMGASGYIRVLEERLPPY